MKIEQLSRQQLVSILKARGVAPGCLRTARLQWLRDCLRSMNSSK